jgi:hypothetical protein
MSAGKDLANNRKGSAVDKFALLCAFVSIVCVFGAHGMDKLAQSGALTNFAFSRAGTVDYAPTASIGGQVGKVQIDPCGESAKTR